MQFRWQAQKKKWDYQTPVDTFSRPCYTIHIFPLLTDVQTKKVPLHTFTEGQIHTVDVGEEATHATVQQHGLTFTLTVATSQLRGRVFPKFPASERDPSFGVKHEEPRDQEDS